MSDETIQSPLGHGHAPEKDPRKGIRAILSATLVLEAIVVLLVLTVISKIGEGAFNTTFNITYVTVVGVGMLIASGVQRFTWGIWFTIALHIATIIGWFVHPSMSLVGLLFTAVWAYIFYLYSDLLRRMDRGFLASQHNTVP